jgi:uncharacterized membrane protein YobD (UPF0266 family)
MKRDVSFSEKQWFRQTWIWVMILAIDALILYGFIQQVVLDKPFGTKPTSDLGVTIVLLLMAVVTVLIFSIRLETVVDRVGIRYRFFPFHLAAKTILWEDISKAYIRKYNPILEYGGWGIRWGTFGKGNAYNVSGNMGLQIELKKGKKLLIGTQKADELDRVIEQLGVKTEN